MQTLLQDLRFGVRMLLKNRLFALVVISTLALGIGANTAMFTVVDAALLRPLPYAEPDRLVYLSETNQKNQTQQREFSYPDYLDLKERSYAFEGVAGYNGRKLTLTHDELKERVQAVRVTSNFFSLLGIQAASGRTFTQQEDQPGGEALVILHHDFWKHRFGGDSSLVGRRINLNGIEHTVIGVLPPDFQFAPISDADLWVPLNPSANETSRRYMHWLKLIGRLKPGVTLDQARAETELIGRRFEESDPQYHQGAMIRVIPLHDQIVGSVKPLLLVLMGAVVFVLLIVCANVANLLLARSAIRTKEIALRVALGAGRWRLIRQLFTESLLLAFCGGALGLLLARWGIDFVIAALPESYPGIKQGLSIDWRALAFTGALSLLTAIIFGLAPALRASKQDLHDSLKDGGRGSNLGRGQRLRNSLIVSEIALALVLLVGSGLLMKSLVRLMRVDPGFDPENLLMFQLSLPADRYGSGDKAGLFYEQLTNRLETLPGVKSAGAVNKLPLVGGDTGSFSIEGQPSTPGSEPMVNVRTVSIGYFEAMGIPILTGRSFTPQDNSGSQPVLLVNQTLAARYFPGSTAIGQRIKFAFTGDRPLEIVGVVGDEKVVPLDNATTPVVYFANLQDSDSAMSVVVRTVNDPLSLTNAIRNEVRSLDDDLLVYQVETMEHHMANRPSTLSRRDPALLIGVFAATAVLLAVIGIYGIVSYSVAQRTHELAVRMALGAGRRDILKLVLKQGGSLAVIGVGFGLIAASMLTRFLSTMLFDVSPGDLQVFLSVAALLVAVALFACYFPARRATKVDPLVALRYE